MKKSKSVSSRRMSDLEFLRQRVKLPKPVDVPWKSAFYDNHSCFEEGNKLAAVQVLPVWIRKALVASDSKLAAGYLWTLLKFAEDKNREVEVQAVLSIYRLGDWKDVAITRMQQWIEAGVKYQHFPGDGDLGGAVDIRLRVLQELAFYEDHRLDQAIYETWLKNQNGETKDLDDVDYAFYLESQGRVLPVEYWLKRLDYAQGQANTYEALEKKQPDGLLDKLQNIFTKYRNEPGAGTHAQTMALTTGALFRLTGKSDYRDYLAGKVQAQLASGSFEPALPPMLKALAAANDKAAKDILSTAMYHQNEMIRETAIAAVGDARNPKATELLIESATKRANEGKGFPAHELRALLRQNTAEADTKYEQLREALLSGKFAWTANPSDFSKLDFVRKK